MSVRRLSAIMFTDMVGYTALMQENEHIAKVKRNRHRNILRKNHKKFGGEIIQYFGDGSLSIFASGLEATQCAIQIQKELLQPLRVDLRIGIHIGDIVLEQDGIYGDSVNVASRIESISVPGSILISSKVYDEVKNQPGITTQTLGSFAFKNVKDRIEVFAIINQGIIFPKPSEINGKLGLPLKSIAVLPFVNLSSDPENEFFSDGISEEILNALATLPGLKVTARTSSFAFKKKQADVREIGRQLGVNNILEGSVRKAGNRVRITTQLVNVADGYHYWSETYDRDLDDIFAIQDEVAHKIVEKLKVNFSEEHRNTSIIGIKTQNIEAYELYLKANFYLNLGSPADIRTAIKFADASLELESGFLDPYVLKLIALIIIGHDGSMPAVEAKEKIEFILHQIHLLEGEHSQVYVSIGSQALYFEHDYIKAKYNFEKALAINPNDAIAHMFYGVYFSLEDDLERMVEELHKAFRLDPINPTVLNMYVLGLYYLEKDNEALEIIDKIFQIAPHHRMSFELQGLIFARQGKFEQAIQSIEQISTETGLRYMKSGLLGYVYALMGRLDEAQGCLQRLFLMQRTHPNIFYDINISFVYVGMNDFDKSLEYLERALISRTPSSTFYFNFPPFKIMKDEPAYQELKSKWVVVN